MQEKTLEFVQAFVSGFFTMEIYRGSDGYTLKIVYFDSYKDDFGLAPDVLTFGPEALDGFCQTVQSRLEAQAMVECGLEGRPPLRFPLMDGYDLLEALEHSRYVLDHFARGQTQSAPQSGTPPLPKGY